MNHYSWDKSWDLLKEWWSLIMSNNGLCFILLSRCLWKCGSRLRLWQMEFLWSLNGSFIMIKAKVCHSTSILTTQFCNTFITRFKPGWCRVSGGTQIYSASHNPRHVVWWTPRHWCWRVGLGGRSSVDLARSWTRFKQSWLSQHQQRWGSIVWLLRNNV